MFDQFQILMKGRPGAIGHSRKTYGWLPPVNRREIPRKHDGRLSSLLLWSEIRTEDDGQLEDRIFAVTDGNLELR